MTTTLTERPATITDEQLDLVKRTVAQGATDAELKLYLYDCARMGVHPLDKLLHFTKRGGKYVPVTSIDLMRMRAAETGEMAGSDDPQFFTGHLQVPYPDAAMVTVYRLTQGQRFAYTATARWAEYYPGDTSGQMWRKMPHTMLGKCAEALALRKGFPKQLAGLYAREEMDQADAPEAKPQPIKATTPQGFEQWEHDLAAVAAEGTHKLQETWKASKPEFRAYLTDTNKAGWERLKTVAAKVTPEQVGA